MNNKELTEALEAARAENEALKNRVAELEGDGAPVEPVEPVAAKIALRSALTSHLEESGIADPWTEAAVVLAHVADFARHSSRFGEGTVRALMSLAE